jgi:DNA-binding SARP family transcriptional activator
MWELGVYEENEDQEELIQVYKKLSKTAKKELGKLRELNFRDIYENIKRTN